MTSTPVSRGQRIAIDPLDKARKIEGFWQQRVIAEMNDYQFTSK